MPQLASYYVVDDLPGSIITHSRLRTILEHIRDGRSLSVFSFYHLQQSGLTALARFAKGECSYGEFKADALVEQVERIAKAECLKVLLAEEQRLADLKQDEAIAAFFAQQAIERKAKESSPGYIAAEKAKDRNTTLRARYGLTMYIARRDYTRVMNILERIDSQLRLAELDRIWLGLEGARYFTHALRNAYHQREANYLIDKYERTSDPWCVVNASAHLRKCGQAEKANTLLSGIDARSLATDKLRSAFATTQGGVMRDLRKKDDALRLGTQAHALTPHDYRPCTLLGAVLLELGRYTEGLRWYQKAQARGAAEDYITGELFGIWKMASPENQRKMESSLGFEYPNFMERIRKSKSFQKKGLI